MVLSAATTAYLDQLILRGEFGHAALPPAAVCLDEIVGGLVVALHAGRRGVVLGRQRERAVARRARGAGLALDAVRLARRRARRARVRLGRHAARHGRRLQLLVQLELELSSEQSKTT